MYTLINTLKGTIGFIPTTITEVRKVDEISLRKLIDYNMFNGCSGVGVLAAISEGYSLQVLTGM